MQLSGLVGASFASSPNRWIQNKKKLQSESEVFIAGVGLEPTASGL